MANKQQIKKFKTASKANMNLSKVILITSPRIDEPGECERIGYLLENYPIGRIHIRKPEASEEELERYINALPAAYRHKYIVSEHISLLKKLGLGGLHLSRHSWQQLQNRPIGMPPKSLLGVSCHSEQELESLAFVPDYAYLSPVAQSISKQDYSPSLSETELRRLCAKTPFDLVALGGISPSNAARMLYLGFTQVATLGYWMSTSIEETERLARGFAQTQMLLAAGLAPTAEAGLGADMRYCSQGAAKAYTIATSITSQNAQRFYSQISLESAAIEEQIESLQGYQAPALVKIGLIGSAEQGKTLIGKLRERYPETLILWDPILKSSSGKVFHEAEEIRKLATLARSVDLLCPNRQEAELMQQALGIERLDELQAALGCDLLIKSHAMSSEGEQQDALFRAESAEPILIGIQPCGTDRHGTGCLYASTLALGLAQGEQAVTAIARAQAAVAAYRLGLEPEEILCRKQPNAMTGNIFITHAADADEAIEQARDALQYELAGSVQLRMKEASFDERLRAGLAIKKLCARYKKAFIVNDNVDLARILAADGVHLGQQDMHPSQARLLLSDNAIIGLTCNTEGDLLRGARLQIDYIGLGSYRYTSTKKRLAPCLGTEGYQRLIGSLRDSGSRLPVYAIGGIQLAETQKLLDAGATAIALSSAIIERIKQIKEMKQIETKHA